MKEGWMGWRLDPLAHPDGGPAAHLQYSTVQSTVQYSTDGGPAAHLDGPAQQLVGGGQLRVVRQTWK